MMITNNEKKWRDVGRVIFGCGLVKGKVHEMVETRMTTAKVVGQGKNEKMIHNPSYLLPADGLDEVIEARLVDGQFVAVPGVNLLLGEIDHRHLDAGGSVRNYCHGGATDVPGTHAANFQVIRLCR